MKFLIFVVFALAVFVFGFAWIARRDRGLSSTPKDLWEEVKNAWHYAIKK